MRMNLSRVFGPGVAGLSVMWSLIGSLGGCSSATQTMDSGLVSVRAGQDTAWLITTPNRASFEMPLIVRNRSTARVYTDECTIKAQRSIDGSWQTVFAPVCLANDSPIELFPGDSVVLRFIAYGTREPATEPQLDPRMTTGLYRAVISMWRADETGTRVSFSEQDRQSSNFVVANH
jgi:hypothetical protein